MAQSASVETSALMIHVRTNGDYSDVPHTTGMTAQQAARAAGLRTGFFTKYFVNGESARSHTALQPGDKVTLSPRVANG
ncbi:MAG: hypothetical protein HYT37_04275 [Candidatus Sungbacteria bacterium]|nr:hypothetical protein [Candidatus Sungbacteria bacterium]